MDGCCESLVESHVSDLCARCAIKDGTGIRVARPVGALSRNKTETLFPFCPVRLHMSVPALPPFGDHLGPPPHTEPPEPVSRCSPLPHKVVDAIERRSMIDVNSGGCESCLHFVKAPPNHSRAREAGPCVKNHPAQHRFHSMNGTRGLPCLQLLPLGQREAGFDKPYADSVDVCCRAGDPV